MTAKKLKQYREKLGLTQKEFGALLGLGRSSINAYENGRKEIPQSKREYLNKVLNPSKKDPATTEHENIILKLDAINEKINLVLAVATKKGKK